MTGNREAKPAPAGRGALEFEVGGLGMLGLAAVVVALCVASFWLGRLSVPARRALPPDGAAEASASVEDGGDIEGDLTFFDRLERAPELSAQGDEETVSSPPEETPAPEPTPAPPTPTLDGPFEIQVLASAERSAADAVVIRLRGRGYPARLVVGERDGAPLYRVRVGGYPDEPAARQVAQAIERQEGLRTWVTR